MAPTRVGSWLWLVALALGGVPDFCAAKRSFTVADDIGLTLFALGAASVSFSRDGHYFAVISVRGLLDSNRPESTLRIFQTEDVEHFLSRPIGSRLPTPVWSISKSTYKDGPIISDIRWLPKPDALAFLAKDESGNDQVFLADIGTKTVHAITPRAKHVTAFDVRNKDNLVYSTLAPGTQPQSTNAVDAIASVATGRPLEDLLFPLAGYPAMAKTHDRSDLWVVRDGRRTRIVDASSGQPVALYFEGQRSLTMSPDGRSAVTALPISTISPEWELLYPPPTPSSPHRIRAGRQDLNALDGIRYVNQYVRIDLVRGTIAPLIDAPAGFGAGWWQGARPSWSEDGAAVLIPNTFVPQNTEPSEMRRHRPCVAVINFRKSTTACVEHLTAETDGDYRYIYDVRFVGTKQVRITHFLKDDAKSTGTYTEDEAGSWVLERVLESNSNLSAPGKTRVEVSIKQDLNSPPILVATSPNAEVSRIIWDPNPQLAEIDLATVSIFSWKDRFGRGWTGGLYRPVGYSDGRRYPLVIQTHGFDQHQFNASGAYTTAFAAQALAAAGILVLQVPDCPYTVDPTEGPCNVAGYQAAVERLVDDGIVDADRVGIVGFSRTCYYVLEALTGSDARFNAASISDGVNEGYLQYITTVDQASNGLADEANAMINARPFGHGLEQWLERAPVFNMDRLNAPLLISANGRRNLLFMWEPYAALRYLSKPVDLVFFGEEGTHVLTNPAQRMVSQGGMVDWMRFWLQGYEDPEQGKAHQYRRWEQLCDMQRAQNPGRPTFCVPSKLH